MSDFGNTFRNFVLAMFLGLLLLIGSLYFSGLIVTYSEYKQLNLDFALSSQPFNTLYELIVFWVNNFDAITFEYDNYFMARIIGAILVPMLLIGFLTWNLRSSLYNLTAL